MITRRTFASALGAGLALAPGLGWPLTARQPPADVVRALLAGRAVVYQGVTIDMPRLAETGNSVPITIDVESPMTQADHVRRLQIIVPGNPEPLAATFLLSPANGRARVATRLRLARTQTVLVLAEHSDGRITAAELPILVTLGACIDELWTD